MNSDNAQNLILAAKNGNSKAFSELYELYFVPVYRYIYFRVKHKEEAEDLVQAVFVKAYHAVAGYKDMGKSPLAYFYTIARNAVVDYWRKQKRVINLEDVEAEVRISPGINPASLAEERVELKRVLKALKKLTPEQEEVVTLKFINDLSNKQISELLGKSEDAVRQIQHRALERLRAIYYEQSI